MGKFDHVEDFVANARDLGFSHIELNYQITPEALERLRRLGDVKVSSLHIPCPRAENNAGVPAFRIPLTTQDAEDSRFILNLALKTVDLAAELKAGFVVVHVGSVTPVVEIERQCRDLYRAGQADTNEFRSLRDLMVETRTASRTPYLERAHKVVRCLQHRARERGVKLGLETRYYYHEIPHLEEMEGLLAACDSQVVGFWHDTGHAENLARLGFTPHREWLERLGPKMFGIHLHDYDGLRDHAAPGTGDIDWDLIARHVPPTALRVLEVSSRNEEAAIRSGVEFLRGKGIV